MVVSNSPGCGGSSDWMASALCRDTQYDPELWFPESDDSESRARTRRARDICRRCPARLECLAWAMKQDMLYGIWGGLSAEERATKRKIMQRRGDAA